MRLSVTTDQGEICVIDVPDDMELENVRALVAMEIPALAAYEGQFELLWNTNPLTDYKKTLRAYGVGEGELLLAVPKVPANPPTTQRPPRNQAPRPTAQTARGASEIGGQVPMIDFASIRVPGGNRSPVRPSANPAASSSNRQRQPLDPESPESIRQMLLGSREQMAILRYRNPPLAEAIEDPERFKRVLESQRKEAEDQMRLRMADPFDVDAQRRIADSIQQSNIDHSMETAMEYMPESFGQVVMLYIECEVNNHSVKAFVDSGAQMTIMSEACAKRCNIQRLIDRRWAGIARGVGTQKIVGRVHLGQLKISGTFLPSSFTILEDQEMDLLLGLDMLRRHQCVIDLKRNCLIIGSNGTETPFLAEADLPSYARLSALEGPKSPGASTSGSAGTRTGSGPTVPEEKILVLTEQGFSREDAKAELLACNGDVDSALASLLSRRDLQ